MPFISKDWRSPGEEWVKYEGGWEKKKTVSSSSAAEEDKDRQISSSLAIDFGSAGGHARSTPTACICHHSSSSSKKSRPVSFPIATSSHDGSSLPRRLRCVERNDEEFDKHYGEFQHQLQRHLERRRLRMARNDLIAIDENNVGMYERRNGRKLNNVWLRLMDETLDQPFCQIILKNTREVAGFNGLAEAMIRLEFIKSITDVRRFSYVASLMHLLFSHDKLRQLSGGAQKIMFRMLEVVADTVYVENRDQHVLRSLLEQLHTTMAIYHVWGSHLGGAHLFKQHLQCRQKITEFVEKMQTEFKQDLASPGLAEHLPEECVREILLRLSHPKDVENAGKTCIVMGNITKEKRIWRELVQTHFTQIQIEHVLSQKPRLKENRDWEELYRCLRRCYGLREEFTEMLNLCRRCCALFWHSIGHPCLVPAAVYMSDSSSDESDDTSPRNSFDLRSDDHFVPVTPTTFLTFFSV